jgi:hypothetical protein
LDIKRCAEHERLNDDAIICNMTRAVKVTLRFPLQPPSAAAAGSTLPATALTCGYSRRMRLTPVSALPSGVTARRGFSGIAHRRRLLPAAAFGENVATRCMC